MRTLILFLVSMFLLQCARAADAPPNPAKYQIIIDDSFTTVERQGVVSGFDSWQAAVGRDLTFQYITASSDNIKSGLSGDPPTNTIYAMRVDDLSTVDCLLQGSDIACYKAPNRVYFQASAITATGAWARLSAHEAGHAMGLQHTNLQPSVMQRDIGSMAENPSYIDVNNYCALQSEGCPNKITK